MIAFINEGKKQALNKLFYGNNEILIPSFPNYEEIPGNLNTKIDTLYMNVNIFKPSCLLISTKGSVDSLLLET